MKLIITEKPSVAMSIAKVLGINRRHDGWMEGNGYYLTWCVGHLVELAQANDYNANYKKWKLGDLPIIPENWLYKVSRGTSDQFEVVKKLINDSKVNKLICATDAGREGELIFRLVYLKAKSSKPFDRLWISSMEDQAIKKGFEDLRNGRDYDHLYEAALCRSHADWLVGINGSRLFSLLYSGKLNIGRVQTPTLAMMVQREWQIQNFIKEKYYINHIDLDGLDATHEKLKDKIQADKIRDATNDQDAKILSVDKSVKSVAAPHLYDLTTLQRDANKYFGLTAKETLNATQSLYEKKLVTYPRTDSQYITDDMKSSVETLLPTIFSFLTFDVQEQGANINCLINNQKVSDHHAIIPTQEIKAFKESLAANEIKVLNLIASRVIFATSRRHQFSETIVLAECSGYEFTAKGKTIVDQGWKRYESLFKTKFKIKEKKKDETVFPDVASGQIFKNVNATISEHDTSPPKRYTEDTLLSAMETAGNEFIEEGGEKKGIGTPATRADIIDKLVRSEYIIRQNKQLVPLESGISLIKAVPETVCSPKLTAEWENRLKEIESGKLKNATFDEMIKLYVIEMVNNNTTIDEGLKGNFKNDERDVIGTCPRCGNNVFEGDKNFYCSNRECKFVLWKNNRFFTDKKKELTTRNAKDFLKKGSSFVKGLYSPKKDKTYDATIVMNDTGDKYVNFKLEFKN